MNYKQRRRQKSAKTPAMNSAVVEIDITLNGYPFHLEDINTEITELFIYF